jgi:hypothetical protein
MHDNRTRKGLVAFFDILGYKNIIDNNKIETVAALISNKLLKIPNRLQELTLETFSPLDLDEYVLRRELAKFTSPVLLSDSFLFTVPFGKNEDSDIKGTRWLVFLIVCRHLTMWMFQNGLPVRGAIGYGPYFVKKTCFAGKPIVEAYRLTNSLDLSGCTLTPSACDQVKKLLAGGTFKAACESINSLLVEYLTPLKDSEQKRLLMIDFSIPNYSTTNIRQIVVESFHGHNKDIPKSAQAKIQNTEMMLRFFVARRKRRKR